jgi:hypothetical protein
MDVSPRSSVPANEHPNPSPTQVERLTIAAVCEWASDLDLGPGAPLEARATTSLASAGFVDFDAIETVHVSSGGAGRS